MVRTVTPMTPIKVMLQKKSAFDSILRKIHTIQHSHFSSIEWMDSTDSNYMAMSMTHMVSSIKGTRS